MHVLPSLPLTGTGGRSRILSCHDHERQNRNFGLQAITHSLISSFCPTCACMPCAVYQKHQKTMMVFLCTSTLQLNYGMEASAAEGDPRSRSVREDTETDRRKVQLQHAARRISHMWRKRGMVADRDQISNSNFTVSFNGS